MKSLLLALVGFALISSVIAMAQTAPPNTVPGTLTNLTHQPPDGAGVPFLLTDGTVLVQGDGNTDWWKLTPDNMGSYLNGTWTQVASLPTGYSPWAFASAVLSDGRVVIVGGEYNFNVFAFTNMGAVYDPLANTWTSLNPPSGWDYIGDSPSTVLPNGKFLVGRKFDTQMAELDPATLTWNAVSSTGKSDWFAEEGWTLMPDGSILTADVLNNPNSERYIPSLGKWVSDGSTIANLQGPPEVGCISYGNGQLYCPPGEIGPAILRPDGTVFATGATHQGQNQGHTAVYKPGTLDTDPGTWTAGPNFLTGDDAGDNYAALLPSGNVLVEGNSGRLYEFDGTNLVPGPFCNGGSLLVLPNGQVLVAGSQVYTATGTYQAAWAPTVFGNPVVPAFIVKRGTTTLLTGQRFNGMSQAQAFGDEFETATNYPLVRLTNKATGHVYYARTHDHSTMGVQTGNIVTTTHMDAPANMETGAATLEVVANGIPSAKIQVFVQ